MARRSGLFDSLTRSRHDPYDLRKQQDARFRGPCGINLRSRRTISITLLIGTVLTTIFLSRRHTPVLTELSHLGWQAGERAFRKAPAASSQASTGSDEFESGVGNSTDWDDWLDAAGWGLEDDDLDGWNPLSSNSAPLTELTLRSCILPPTAYIDLCAPTTSLREDAERGPWVRVDRDLNKRVGTSYYYLYLYYRRLPLSSSAAVITNITMLKHHATDNDLAPGGLWVEVSTDLRKGVWPYLPSLFLHYKVMEQPEIRSARRVAGQAGIGDMEPITELDILYGKEDVQPFWGFEAYPTYISGGEDDSKAIDPTTGKGSRAGTRLSYRRGTKPLPDKPDLRFTEDGNFRILQVADLHLSTGPGACRDIGGSREAECKAMGADKYSLEWLKTALDEVRPDFVVFSGDQLNGQDTSWDAFSTLMKWAPLVWERRLPWTSVFGNHDGEVDLSNAEQMAILVRMPYYVGEAGPEDVDGSGNYMKSVKSNDTSDTVLFNMYFFDSHANVKTVNPFASKGYDWLKASQINYFHSLSSSVKAITRPYVPGSSSPSRTRPPTRRQIPADEDDDDSLLPAIIPDEEAAPRPAVTSVAGDGPFGVGGDDDLFADLPAPPEALPKGPTAAEPLLAKPNAMAFFHIPLPESYDAPIDVALDGSRLFVGEQHEGKGSPLHNSGFFEQGLLKAGELVSDAGKDGAKDEFWDGEFSQKTSGRPEVKVVSNGHCHITESCRRIKGIWLCFDGGSSYSGYGKAGFARRVRVYDVSAYGETIKTHKLLDDLTTIDPAVLVGEHALGDP